MTGENFAVLQNAQATPLSDIPVVAEREFRNRVLAEVENGARISALFASPLPCEGSLSPSQGGRAAQSVRLYCVLARDSARGLAALAADVGDSYEALTPDCAQAHWFEREIAEQWGVRPEGHPWLKPIRFHASYRPGHDAWGRAAEAEILPGVTDYYRIEGEEVHEVAVGPVHAGVIEPGHFRFQCHGENVYHLEIELGYQHRGVERALVGGPDKRTVHFMETLAGDATIGHALAYAQNVEALAGISVPMRAAVLRAVALELERLANHVGDMGALAGDVGYLPTASYCGRLRGDMLNLTALICGNRFGRGLVRPGGVEFDLRPAHVADLRERLEAAFRDTKNAVELLWNTPSVLARFEETGVVKADLAEELGLVGPAARASGLRRDVRADLPTGFYREVKMPMAGMATGDVYARAMVRWQEIENSVGYVLDCLELLPAGAVRAEMRDLHPESLAVSLVEGWRGEICHVALTDARGRFAQYKVCDPSFHNWIGLAMALRGQQISDFPLCNKSFNLSYCGHDL